jgi:hypothetical protein
MFEYGSHTGKQTRAGKKEYATMDRSSVDSSIVPGEGLRFIFTHEFQNLLKIGTIYYNSQRRIAISRDRTYEQAHTNWCRQLLELQAVDL